MAVEDGFKRDVRHAISDSKALEGRS
jgi:hypothetical protein